MRSVLNWTPQLQVLEIRFSNCFLYWDHTGKAAVELLEAFPDLEVERAGPDRTTLTCPSTGVKMEYSFNSARIRADAHGNTKTAIKEYADKFFEIIIDHLSVKTLTRVGNLNHYEMTFESEIDVLKALPRVGSLLGVKVSGILEQSQDSQLSSLRVQSFRTHLDNGKTGLMISGRHDKKESIISGPLAGVLARHLPPSFHCLNLEFDRFTLAPMSARDLIPSALLESNDKMFRTQILDPISSHLKNGT